MMTRKPLRRTEAEDLLVSDWVHTTYGTGWIEAIGDDYATVAFDRDQRRVLRFDEIHKCKHAGGGFDRRHG